MAKFIVFFCILFICVVYVTFQVHSVVHRLIFYIFLCALCVFTFVSGEDSLPFFLTLLSTLSVSFWISWHDTLCFLSDCCVVLYLHSSASILLACAGMGTIVDDTVWLVAAIDGALVYCSWFVFSFHLCRLHHLHSILVSFCVVLASIHSYVLGLLVFFALKSVELSLSLGVTHWVIVLLHVTKAVLVHIVSFLLFNITYIVCHALCSFLCFSAFLWCIHTLLSYHV